MAESFDPFSGKSSKQAHTGDPKEKLVSNFASYLMLKAKEFEASKTPEAAVLRSEDFQEWLEEEIDQSLEMDSWDENDLARLTALFFLYLTCGE